MKRTSLLFVCLLAGTAASNAAVVFADDFSYANATTLHGQTPDTGSGTWSGPSAWQVNDGAVALVGGGGTVNGYFTDSLSAGETLTVTFTTLAISGFLGDGWARVSLYDTGERAYMGDLGGPTTYWTIGGNMGSQTTTDSNQTNTATYTYVFDTGAWTFATNGGSYSGTATAGYAINHLELGGGGPMDGNPSNIKLDGITVTIVPEPGSAVLAAMGMMALCFRRRSR